MYQGIEILVKQGTGKNTLTCPRTGETFSVKDCEKVYVSWDMRFQIKVT